MSLMLEPAKEHYEITQATYYTSALYTEPLTPQYINAPGPNEPCKRGQSPWPANKWNFYDFWYQHNNHYIHKINDKFQYRLFQGYHSGIIGCATLDHQPSPHDVSASKRHYPDDIIGQTAGGVCVGLQIGAIFGCLHTFNVAREAGIFQSIAMPANRWLPLHKANLHFRSRIFITCMLQASTFFASYCFTDACVSQIREKDDFFNPLIGGFVSGLSLYAWFKSPFNTIPLGLIFGLYMAVFRFGILPDGTPKLCLDFSRPLWGVIGGTQTWIFQREPTPDRIFYQWWDQKYRN